MATQSPYGTFLPQNIPDVNTAQMQQALATKLMERGMTGADKLHPAGGGFGYVPKYGVGNILSDAASMYGGMKMQQMANQNLADIYQRQFNQMTGYSQPQFAGQGLMAPQGAMSMQSAPNGVAAQNQTAAPGFGYGSAIGLGQGVNPYNYENATGQLGQGFMFR